MKASGKQSWLKVMILSSTLYLLIGIIFPLFSKSLSPREIPNLWRLLSFLTSAFVYGIHIGYEHSRLHNTPLQIAFHTSLAVALGAIVLAGFINIEALWANPGNHNSLLTAIFLWPLITGVPAFIVAVIIAIGIAKIKNKTNIKVL